MTITKAKQMNKTSRKRADHVLKRMFPSAIRYTRNDIANSGFLWYYDDIAVFMKRSFSKDRRAIAKVYRNFGKKRNDVPPVRDFRFSSHAIKRFNDRGITKNQAHEAVNKGIELNDSDRYSTKKKDRKIYLWKDLQIAVEYSGNYPIVVSGHYLRKYTDEYFIDKLPEMLQLMYEADPTVSVSVHCLENSRTSEKISSNMEMHREKDVLKWFMGKAQTVGLTPQEIAEYEALKMCFNDRYGVSNDWWLKSPEEVPLQHRIWDWARADLYHAQKPGIPQDWWPSNETTYSLNFNINTSSGIPSSIKKVFLEYGINLWEQHKENLHVTPLCDWKGRKTHMLLLKMIAPHDWAISEKHL